MPPHPLTNFEIHKCYQNEPNFNGAYSTSNLPKIKNGAYVINLEEHESIGTHWKLCMRMVITEEHLTMQYILIALELYIFQKKFKNS